MKLLLLLFLLNIFLPCFSLKLSENQKFDDSKSDTAAIFDEIELQLNDQNMEMNFKDDEPEIQRSKRSYKKHRHLSHSFHQKKNNNKYANNDNEKVYPGYNVDIDVACVINEDCAFPYTCQYTVMGRRCIKDLTIEYSQPKYDGIPTIEELELIFNQTFDLDLPWNQ